MLEKYKGMPVYGAEVDAFGVVTEARHKPADSPRDNSSTLVYGFWLTRVGPGFKPGTGFCHLILGDEVVETTWDEVKERLQQENDVYPGSLLIIE